MLRTKTKLGIARAINRVIVGSRTVLGRDALVNAARGEINWKLDLNEGIDLAIYLGRYQSIPERVVNAHIRPGALVIDIGANIGAHALPLARYVGPEGRVIAVEPTRFAYGKLQANIAANPELTERVIAIQAALTDGAAESAVPNAFYSRWPLGKATADQHGEHLGKMESMNGGRFLPLDDLLDEVRATRPLPPQVEFIKLDVDGNELQVIKGGVKTLRTNRPTLLIEIAPYVQDEVPGRFEGLLNALSSIGYRLENATTGASLPNSCAELRKLITFGAGIDAIARPA